MRTRSIATRIAKDSDADSKGFLREVGGIAMRSRSVAMRRRSIAARRRSVATRRHRQEYLCHKWLLLWHRLAPKNIS